MSLIDILGPAAIPTVILLIAGIVMLVIEMFTPGLGVSGGVALLCLIAVVVIQIGWGSAEVAAYIVAIVLLLIILMLFWFIRSFQRGRLSRSFLVLNENIDASSSSITEADRDVLIGKRGVAVTPLRPAGIGQIEGRRIDVMTAGAFVEADRPIEVVQAEGLHVLVRECKPEQPAEPEAAQ